MEIQLKKGVLDTLVLTALKDGDSYGYRIVQNLHGTIDISESTLYPILRRLESAGCLKTYSVAHNGRLRKYYSLTKLGQRKIDLFLENWASVEKAYLFIKSKN